MEGWEGGESERENKRGGGVGDGLMCVYPVGGGERYVMNL